ncbi:GntR family transcriptional regulator [Streptomyces physcomitrii]|uniref:GntR family transcriptional regulator n=1 Tax=Streptomyces physcomitrii TaxID=2724184 RepID=A0ABX1H3T2_9ACTN|nr:GntR family transcriptional regulator [Streptomyces physcomitrii]NKI42698.1 GntR family transcriptional regulator [Streptomyces physcomitrii]
MPDPAASVPPYRRYAETLRNDIQGRVLAAGDKLPSEHQLAERFGTTRATIRKAIALLRAEGLVVSHQGKGAFVRSAPRVRMLGGGEHYRMRRGSGKSNFNAEAEAQGRAAVQHIREVREALAPPEVAEALDVPFGESVIVRRRLFTVDEEPMQLVDGYYPVDLARNTPIAEPRRIRGGVHAFLENPAGPVRRRVARFVEDLHVRMPTPSEVSELNIPPGVPVARVFRTAYDAEGVPLEVLDSLVPCDRHAFRYVIDVPAAGDTQQT